jgi:hypothetical protein
MRKLVSRLAILAVLAPGAIWVSGAGETAPLAPNAIPVERLMLIQPAQFIHLGRPYCWYPYGWAGPGWYWCGYGTRAGIGWGGFYGWNGWVVPRSYRSMRIGPGYRFRRY